MEKKMAYRQYLVLASGGITVNDQWYPEGDTANIPEEYAEDLIKQGKIKDPVRKSEPGVGPNNVRTPGSPVPTAVKAAEPQGTSALDKFKAPETPAQDAPPAINADGSQVRSSASPKQGAQEPIRAGLGVRDSDGLVANQGEALGNRPGQPVTEKEAFPTADVEDRSQAGKATNPATNPGAKVGQAPNPKTAGTVGKPAPGVKATET